jgi:hypothetical protein
MFEIDSAGRDASWFFPRYTAWKHLRLISSLAGVCFLFGLVVGMGSEFFDEWLPKGIHASHRDLSLVGGSVALAAANLFFVVRTIGLSARRTEIKTEYMVVTGRLVQVGAVERDMPGKGKVGAPVWEPVAECEITEGESLKVLKLFVSPFGWSTKEEALSYAHSRVHGGSSVRIALDPMKGEGFLLPMDTAAIARHILTPTIISGILAVLVLVVSLGSGAWWRVGLEVKTRMSLTRSSASYP